MSADRWEPLQSAEGVTVHDGHGGLVNVPARLIAAAPEMLALLREMAEPHDCPCHFCDRSRPLTSGDHREGCRLKALLGRLDRLAP